MWPQIEHQTLWTTAKQRGLKWPSGWENLSGAPLEDRGRPAVSFQKAAVLTGLPYVAELLFICPASKGAVLVVVILRFEINHKKIQSKNNNLGHSKVLKSRFVWANVTFTFLLSEII